MLEMRNFLNKKINKKGFTLAELLVVVAIIAILVAVSIPIFTGQLNKAKVNTDKANLRAAKAAAVNLYLSNDNAVPTGKTFYDIELGKMVDDEPDGYNEGKVKVENAEVEAKGAVVKVTYTDGTGDVEGAVSAAWVRVTP